MQWRVTKLAHDCMDKEWHRMNTAMQVNDEHLDLILSVHKQATKEWLHRWKKTWKTIFTEAVLKMSQHAFTFTHGDSQEIKCNACGHAWGDRTDFDDQARDHVLANCPEA